MFIAERHVYRPEDADKYVTKRGKGGENQKRHIVGARSPRPAGWGGD